MQPFDRTPFFPQCHGASRNHTNAFSTKTVPHRLAQGHQRRNFAAPHTTFEPGSPKNLLSSPHLHCRASSPELLPALHLQNTRKLPVISSTVTLQSSKSSTSQRVKVSKTSASFKTPSTAKRLTVNNLYKGSKKLLGAPGLTTRSDRTLLGTYNGSTRWTGILRVLGTHNNLSA